MTATPAVEPRSHVELLIDWIWQYYVSRAHWPTFREVDRAVDRLTRRDLAEVAREVPRWWLYPDLSRQPDIFPMDTEVKLTTESVSRVEGGHTVVELAARVVATIVGIADEFEPDEPTQQLIVDSDELAESLRLTPGQRTQLSVFGTFITNNDLPGIWNGLGGKQEGGWTLTVDERGTRRYRGINSAEDLLQLVASIRDAEERERRRHVVPVVGLSEVEEAPVSTPMIPSPPLIVEEPDESHDGHTAAQQSFVGASGDVWHFDETRRLGDGGFGSVFAGEGANGEPVAVKVIVLDPAERQPELREVEIAERISAAPHDHLLPVRDYLLEPTRLLLVMDRADNSLARALEEGMTDEERLTVLRDLAQGLVELHSVPALHRDIKPENALLHRGVWKLADFGIARDLNAQTASLTWRGAGSLHYMAPELFLPPYAANVKSDLYAFGCLAYELCTGEVPFSGIDTAEIARRHRVEPIPPMPETVNGTLRRLIVRLLDKLPEHRPQDARDVVEHLGRIALGPPSPGATKLQTLASRLVEEQSFAVAADQAAQVLEEEKHIRISQALADLRAVIAEGVELVAEALPEARCPEEYLGLVLVADQATVKFNVWDKIAAQRTADGRSAGPTVYIDVPDDHVMYGQVDGSNQRMIDEPPIANLWCVLKAGRLSWNVLRYRKDGLDRGQYPYGPENRAHGFLPPIFFDANVYPHAFAKAGMHLFSVTSQPLTAEVVRELFAAALALPEDA